MSELAGPDEPLILKDGRRIDTKTGRVVKSASQVVLPSSSPVGDISANPARRRVEDTGIPAATLSSLMAVAAFKLCNFDPIDICEALGTTPDMLYAVERHSEYGKVVELLSDAIKNIAQADARGALAIAAPHAARHLINNIDADDDVLAQEAAKFVLGGNGIGKGNENIGGMAGAFRIEIIDKRDEANQPSISIKVGV